MSSCLTWANPVRIGDLAENLIRLAGFKVRNQQNPDSGIAIEVIGKRPGEKLYEELFYNRGHARPTAHPKIMRADGAMTGCQDLDHALQALTEAMLQEDERRAKAILFFSD